MRACLISTPLDSLALQVDRIGFATPVPLDATKTTHEARDSCRVTYGLALDR